MQKLEFAHLKEGGWGVRKQKKLVKSNENLKKRKIIKIKKGLENNILKNHLF